MLFATISQPAVFLWMLFCGGIMALWYSLMAGIRHLMEAGFFLSLICDLIFGLGCAAIMIAGLIIGDYGRVRLYSVFGAILGAIMTKNGLITPFQNLFGRFGSFWRRIVTKLAKYRLIKVLFR